MQVADTESSAAANASARAAPDVPSEQLGDAVHVIQHSKSTPAPTTPGKRALDALCPTPQSKDRKLARLLQIAPTAAACTYDVGIPALQPSLNWSTTSEPQDQDGLRPAQSDQDKTQQPSHLDSPQANSEIDTSRVLRVSLETKQEAYGISVPCCQGNSSHEDGRSSRDQHTSVSDAQPIPRRFSGNLNHGAHAQSQGHHGPMQLHAPTSAAGQAAAGAAAAAQHHHPAHSRPPRPGSVHQHVAEGQPTSSSSRAHNPQLSQLSNAANGRGASHGQEPGYEGTFSRLDDGKSLQQKQKERRARKAQFLLGEADDVKGPAVGFALSLPAGPPHQAVKLSAHATAHMPMPPNR